MQLPASLTAPAPEVSVPAAGPKPGPVLRWVPAQREPDREWHRGSALPGEPLPTTASHLVHIVSRPHPGHRGSEPACVSAAAESWGHQIIGAAHLPRPHLLFSCPWDSLARPSLDPPACPLSAEPAARLWSGPRAFRQPLHLLAGCAASGTARGLWGLAPSCLTNPQAQQFSEGGPVA